MSLSTLGEVYPKFAPSCCREGCVMVGISDSDHFTTFSAARLVGVTLCPGIAARDEGFWSRVEDRVVRRLPPTCSATR